MNRINIFELEDFDWMPNVIRDGLTSILKSGHEFIGSAQTWAPYVQKLLSKTKHTQIIDLCSGGGGPSPQILSALQNKSLKLIMTDLYPSEDAILKFMNVDNVEYLPESINASKVPSRLHGVRTLFACFHHMPPKVAHSILKSAFEDRVPIGIFELTSQEILPALFYAFAFPLMSPLLLLKNNPDVLQILFTFVFPVIPLVIAWDGFASCLRTYGVSDFEELTQDLQSSDYTWQIQEITMPLVPFKIPLIMGYPSN